MPKKAAAGGGNYLGGEGLVALGHEGGVVLLFKREQLSDYVGENGTATRIATDILVLAPAARNGEFWPSQDIINSAVTSKLVDEDNGTAVAARLAVGKRGGREYPMANPPSEPEYALVEAVYAQHGVDINATDADVQLFKILNAAHVAEKRENARAAVGAVNTSKGGSAPADGGPPF